MLLNVDVLNVKFSAIIDSTGLLCVVRLSTKVERDMVIVPLFDRIDIPTLLSPMPWIYEYIRVLEVRVSEFMEISVVP